MGFHRVAILIGLAASLGVLLLAALLSPDPRGVGTHERLGLPPCRYLMAEGRPCPSCGLTTAFANLVRLRLRAAWAANPAGLPLFLAVLALPPWLLHAWWSRSDPFRFLNHRLGRYLPALLVGLVLLSWLVRGGLG
jgi:hypothetical protein